MSLHPSSLYNLRAKSYVVGYNMKRIIERIPLDYDQIRLVVEKENRLTIGISCSIFVGS